MYLSRKGLFVRGNTAHLIEIAIESRCHLSNLLRLKDFSGVFHNTLIMDFSLLHISFIYRRFLLINEIALCAIAYSL